MFFRICKIMLLLAVVSTLPAFAQKKDEAQKQQEAFIQKLQEEQDERISTFVTQLDVDDFQKEIIKQKIRSYYQKRKLIYQNNELKYFERDEQIAALTNHHFSDIKELISDENMTQIQSFVKDNTAVLKKQKKKRIKKNKDN